VNSVSPPPHEQSPGDERHSFESGRNAGLQAAKQLTAEAPFTRDQLAWLNGFLMGLVERSPKHEPNPSAADLPICASSGTNPGAPFAPSTAAAFAEPALAPLQAASPVKLTDDPSPTPPAFALLGAVEGLGKHVAATQTVNETSESTVHLRATMASARKSTGGEEANQKYTSDNPFAARVQQVSATPTRTPNAWRVTLDVEGSGLRCRPGDCLGVVPSNDPDLVRKVLRRLGAKGQETITTSRGTGPAWRALLEEFNIVTVTRELLWLLSNSTRNHHEAAQLESLAAGPITELNLQAILRRFPGTKPALNDFVNQLSPLVPQYFPLASARSRHADALEFFAVKTPLESRSVIASLEQERLDQGDWLPVFVDTRPEGHPPADVDAPVIIMAPGPGVASAFAFLAERAATRGSGRNWLFTSPIGNETTLTFYEHFSAWQTARVITRLDVAPPEKLSLRLLEQAEMIQAWIVDGSYLYLYGTEDDCKMLERGLVHLLVTRARIPQEEAEHRLQAMRQRGQLRIQHLD
jgi:sulfite reductase (NADPH) flavoprotein alpha-component